MISVKFGDRCPITDINKWHKVLLQILSGSGKSYSNSEIYAHVVHLICRHQWGLVLLGGRYYRAELHNPEDGELAVGQLVRVYAERDGVLLVASNIA